MIFRSFISALRSFTDINKNYILFKRTLMPRIPYTGLVIFRPASAKNYITTTPSVLLERQSTSQTELCHHNTVSTSIETIHILDRTISPQHRQYFYRETIHTPDRTMSPQHSQCFYRDNPHPTQNYVTTTPSVLP